MSLFIGVPNNMKFRIDDNLKVKFTNVGHILGGGVANLEITENGTKKQLAYTGDIGRPNPPIIKHPEPFPQADILITESTYGDRLHSNDIDAEEELLNIIIHTCVNKRGKLIIPAFSVGRTQEVVYALNNFLNAGRLPKVKVYVDSPLAIDATTVFRTHPECCNSEFVKAMETNPDPFGFKKNLHYITHQQDSKKLNERKEPCIIISASGMMEAGRVKHHLANNISNPKNTVLAVGYCSPVTLGARILRGDKEVSIHGTVYKVKAEIRQLDSFSGHADYNEMIKFLDCQDKEAIEKLFIVHGEYEAQKNYKELLKQAGFKNIEIPSRGQVFDI
jgi:metallo-beta-lactamase family protein